MIERGDALGEAALDAVPFGRGDEAGQQVVGKDALRAFVASVDGESDALGEEGQVGGLLAALEFIVGKPGQGLGQSAVVRRAGRRSLPASRRRRSRADSLRIRLRLPLEDWCS